VDVSALVRDRAEVLGRGHGRTVRTEVAPSLWVRGEAGLLQRALDNLLGNAFKFSPPDTPVELRAFAAGADVVVEVRDYGRGIPRAEQETVFNRFARGAAAQGREGLGLGLALVREVVTWHRGRVTLESTEGTGSVFRLAIPAGREGAGVGEDPRRR
jgi:signal transduction histidine kinase